MPARSGLEVVITALTRNQVYRQRYRGFESHPLRHSEMTFVCQMTAYISTAKVFLRSNPQSLTLDCRGLQVCFFLKLPLTARILALRRGSMPDGAFLRFKIATVRADCDFVFGRNIINNSNNSNRKMEWILHGKFSAQVSPIKLRYAPCKPRITARLGWQ